VDPGERAAKRRQARESHQAMKKKTKGPR